MEGSRFSSGQTNGNQGQKALAALTREKPTCASLEASCEVKANCELGIRRGGQAQHFEVH